MEERRNTKDLDSFKKLEDRLGKVKAYCGENSMRIENLRNKFKKVRELMGEVSKQQNVAVNQVIAGRKK